MSSLSFDRHQFYKAPAHQSVGAMLNFRCGEKSKGISVSRQTGLDFDDLAGMHVFTPQIRPHKNSEWAKDPSQVMELLLTVFPALSGYNPERSPSFRRAARWSEVIRLYFAYGESARSVAEQLSCSVGAVEFLIVGIRRARLGLTVDGKPRKSV
jgi:hypothetical protein